MSKNPKRRKLIALGLVLGIGIGFLNQTIQKISENFISTLSLSQKLPLRRGWEKVDLQQLLAKKNFQTDQSGSTFEKISYNGKNFDIKYSIDSGLQQSVEHSYKKAKVPYGAFVALDAKTGQVLAMVSHGLKTENMTLRSTFPAASIFKVITAAAAIESGKLKHSSLIPVKGSYHTLYKTNVLAAGGINPERTPRFARLISFEDALAKSVNSVFGKVGIFGVGPNILQQVADRFLFNKQIPFEMPVSKSQAPIPSTDAFELAESASGFTKKNTLSPLHGALIAAAVANDGVLMEPSIVSNVSETREQGGAENLKPIYEFQPKVWGKIIDKSTADQLAIMMHRTVTAGTSRRAFRGWNRSLALSDVFIAGKTGTLNGWDPVGRYDWFVGYADYEGRKIAVASLCVHGPRHGIKASQIARSAFEAYFKRVIAIESVNENRRRI